MSNMWECSRCECLNNLGVIQCIVCDAHYSTRIRRCDLCTTVNQPTDENCHGCGVKRSVFKREMNTHVQPTRLPTRLPTRSPTRSPTAPVKQLKPIRRDHLPAPTRTPPAPPVPQITRRPTVLPDDVIADDCKCIGCTRNRITISLSMMKHPVKWHTGKIDGEGKFYKCIKTAAVYVDDSILVRSLMRRGLDRSEIVSMLQRLKYPPDTSAPVVVEVNDSYTICCPHCGIYTILPIADINCGIYRHAEDHVGPHDRVEHIAAAVGKKPSHGCLRGIALKKIKGVLRVLPCTLNDRIIAE